MHRVLPDGFMTIAELMDAMQTFVDERDWEQFHSPKNLATGLIIEASELLECVQWDDPTPAEIRTNPKRLEHLGEEIADVFLYLIRLISVMDLDLIELAREKLVKNQMKYPVEQSKGIWTGPWE